METLVRKRGNIKRRVTNFRNFIAKVNEGDISDKIKSEINERLSLFKAEVLHDFNDVQTQIEESITGDTATIAAEFEAQQEQRDIFEDEYYETVAYASMLVAIPEEQNLSSSTPVNSIQAPVISTPASTSCIKLPTIELPKFNGKLEQWLQFRDTFLSLIHYNTSISEIQKFLYLKSSLEDSALEVIKAIELSANNYALAWDLLCKKYNNSKALIRNHIKALLALPTINKESSKEITAFKDAILNHVRSLKSLKQPVNDWNIPLMVVILDKLDKNTAKEWENLHLSEDFPSYEVLVDFLQSRADLLENLETRTAETLTNTESSNIKKSYKQRPFNTHKQHAFLANHNFACYYCKGSHSIYTCTNFLQLGVEDRTKEVHKLNLCKNCLRPNHNINDCKSSGCRRCKGKHNSLLHKERTDPGNVALSAQHPKLPCLLPTALVNAIDPQGNVRSVLRALLDTGSQSNFITEDTARYLDLEVTPTTVTVSGVNNTETNIIGRCSVKIRSRHSQFCQDIKFLVIQTITGDLPQSPINAKQLSVPSHLNLADSTFAHPGPINILLGAGIFFDILLAGKVNLGPTKPTILQTRLGWVFAGGIDDTHLHFASVKCNVNKNTDINTQLTRFWELEECNSTRNQPETFCETQFLETFERNEEGRFVVTIPFINPLSLLGDSRESALKRFLAYERKLVSNEKLRIPYVEFMREYKELKHMTPVCADKPSDYEYYLPHHGVINEGSVTTKLRVVFDASNPTTTGYSLNSLQGVGPPIQQDLFSILIRFRQHRFAIAADVTKMYRQILVNDKDRCLQKIFWRADPSETLQVFELNTVTYGNAYAPFAAIRCLHELAYQHLKAHPRAAQVILHDFYVDDWLSGGETVEDVLELAKEVTKILESGCFPLRKWISNSPEVMKSIEHNEGLACLNLGENENTKTLGLYWETIGDNFVFHISDTAPGIVTKRVILSMTGQIFDPLGLLGACTITAKILLQSLWKEKVGWDEPLSNTLQSEWLTFRKEVVTLNSIKIPRHVLGQTKDNLQLHGFADASEKAYGACVYIVDSGRSAKLIAFKSRVAPLKTQTMPRLELCAALLLSHLVAKVLSALRLEFTKIYLWSDSTIVLCWLQKPRGEFKIFVANRVGQIQDLTENATWRYVPSKQNPADLVSRGINPNELLHSSLWWHGPQFLLEPEEAWPRTPLSVNSTLPELRNKIQVFALAITTENDMSMRFSTLGRAKRVTAYCLRFIKNLSLPKEQRMNKTLTAIELENALNSLIKNAQSIYYCKEINSLQRSAAVMANSGIISLKPFLDERGILRVGGRLNSSELTFNQKHPKILPPKSHLTRLILRYEHIKLGHAGPSQTLYSSRERFWPVHGRKLCKEIVHHCVRCFKAKPINKVPIMGDLPASRVTPSYPFQITGVDYAGPFLLKRHKGRGAKMEKAYLSIFVCFTTKSTHIEIVSDLTTQAFVAALRRFVARRGKPQHIHSDNGTNFVGASRELKSIIDSLKTEREQIETYLADEGIQWHFIPPSAPHFGGLWEGTVKRTKFHLLRIMAGISVTYEEFCTITCQIESILNSRPLTPLSNHPEDLEPLTPSHFLIGRTMCAVPDPELSDTPSGRLGNFQRVQQVVQTFWRRWTREYLPELQPRTKWRVDHGTQLTVGDLALIRDDTQPPLRWPLGRIMEIHPGPDGRTRVVTLRTQRGLVKRPVAKVFPLPKNEDEDPNIQ